MAEENGGHLPDGRQARVNIVEAQGDENRLKHQNARSVAQRRLCQEPEGFPPVLSPVPPPEGQQDRQHGKDAGGRLVRGTHGQASQGGGGAVAPAAPSGQQKGRGGYQDGQRHIRRVILIGDALQEIGRQPQGQNGGQGPKRRRLVPAKHPDHRRAGQRQKQDGDKLRKGRHIGQIRVPMNQLGQVHREETAPAVPPVHACGAAGHIVDVVEVCPEDGAEGQQIRRREKKHRPFQPPGRPGKAFTGPGRGRGVLPKDQAEF